MFEVEEEVEIAILKKVEISSAVISLRSDGIMQFALKPVEDYTVNDLKNANQVAGILGKGRAYPNLIFIEHFLNPDAECRAHAASEESNRFTIADAFVINSLALKIIGNFYIKVNRPSRPTRLFSNEEEAVNWLYSFL